MKILFLIYFPLLFATTMFAQVQDFENAKKLSGELNQPILMIFSGSDWCKPCIKLKKEVLQSTSFTAFAEKKLVLLEVDFPYRKANRLSKAKQKANDQLAEKYNPEGDFPKLLLLNPAGEVLGGLVSRGTSGLIKEVEAIIESQR